MKKSSIFVYTVTFFFDDDVFLTCFLSKYNVQTHTQCNEATELEEDTLDYSFTQLVNTEYLNNATKDIQFAWLFFRM